LNNLSSKCDLKKLGLALDLSHAGFAAVLDESGATVLAQSARPAGTRHDDVAAWTEGLLTQAGGTFADMAWIAVGVGPGSFTGIRIAMSFAQGLALPRALPVHGFTSFEALHLSALGAGVLEEGQASVAVIPANSGRFYVSQSLGDSGALMTGEDLAVLCSGSRVPSPPTPLPEGEGSQKFSVVLIAPEVTPAMTARAVGYAGVWTPGDQWDAVAIARHARAHHRTLARPVYLQLSAAEEKFGAADHEGATV
jgi:tRNA threonylcarbamoyl adenosine modification protein YeaZ